MAGRRALIVPLLLAVALVSGCKNERAAKQAELEHNRRTVTAESTHDASAAIVDEDYRFRLANPGEGWKTVSEEEARKFIPDAVAMVFDADVKGSVIVEHLPGASIEQYLELVEAGASPGVSFEPLARVEFQGHEAARLDYTEVIGEFPWVHEVLIIRRGDWIYMIDVWGAEQHRGRFAAVFQAFSLLDGEVVPRSTKHASSADAHGVGWRVRDGVFRSAITHVEVSPPDSLRLIVGPELRSSMDADAELGFAGPATFYAVIQPQPWTSATLADARARQAEFVADEYPDSHEHIEFELAGERVPVDSWIEGPVRYSMALLEFGGARLALLAWWPPAFDEIHRPRLLELGAGLRGLDAAEREALEAELAGLPDSEQAVGPSWRIGGGRYLDFAHSLRWAKPSIPGAPELWTFVTGAEAAEWDDDAEVALVDRRTGRSAGVVHFPGAGSVDDETWRRTATGTWPGIDFGEPREAIVAGRPAELFVGEFNLEGDTHRAWMASLRRGADGLALFYDSPIADDPRDDEIFQALLAGLDLDDLPEIETRDGRWFDHRLGVSLVVSPTWQAVDKTPPQLGGIGRGTLWTAGGKEHLMVLGVHPPQHGQDLDWFEGLFEQLARDRLGTLAKDVASRRELSVAGRRGRQLSWSKPANTITLARNGGTFYMFLVIDTPAVAQTLLDTVEFLD
jgi:hypothetical protein